MKRDFTINNYNHILDVISQIEAEKLCDVTDMLGDAVLGVKHLLGDLGLFNKMKDLDKYHEEVLDMRNTTADQINAIFEQISAADSREGGQSEGTIGRCRYAADGIRKYIKGLSEIGATGITALQRGESLGDCFSSAHIRVQMCVLEYEKQHPLTALDMDKVLTDPDLTEQKKRDIKFLLYKAPEPYRSIYLEHVKNLNIVVYDLGEPDGDGHAGCLYDEKTGKVYLIDNDGNFIKDIRGPYNTFFHECGHALDDLEKDIGKLSPSYSFQGTDLNDWIFTDVRKYVENYIDARYPNLSTADKLVLLRSMNLTDDASFAYEGDERELNAVLRQYRETIISGLQNDLRGEVNEAASDIFGGITNNAVIGDFGHRKEDGQSGNCYTYWYNGRKRTNKQTSELWAEFFAAKMTGDEAALASIKSHFPNAYEAMEQMAQDMAAG